MSRRIALLEHYLGNISTGLNGSLLTLNHRERNLMLAVSCMYGQSIERSWERLEYHRVHLHGV